MHRIMIFLIVPALLAGTKYAGEFQELQVGARASAMGGTGIAQFGDPTVLYFNPAGTFFTPRSAHLMHAENFAGIVKNEFGAVVFPHGSMSLGLGIQYVHTDGIKLTTLPDTTSSPGSNNIPIAYDTVGTADYLFYINCSKGGEHLAFGANVKVFYRDLSAITGYGGGLDLGVAYRVDYLKAGVTVRDFILSPLVWSSGLKETILPKIALGLAPTIPLRAVNSTITIETDIVKVIDIAGFDVNLGLEYGYKELLFGRMGVYQGNFTMGVGLQYKKFSLDYAFMTHPDLENTNKISAGLRF
ncbi:MAG: hypothetical protein JSW49_00985 [candidate division WOR-3 bacterium]|nr:MAG: hypothetical protein JSW49_00985 [candidate division WOR-3 bacterium]